MSDGMKATIAALYEYGQWANERLLDKMRGLGQDDLTRRFSQGSQAVLPTLVHLYGADLRWLARWQKLPPPEVAPADYPSVEAVEARWRPVWAERRTYLDGLDEAALKEQIAFTRPAGTVWIVRWQGIVHCANHGTQHRSELAMMLSDLGRSPGDMDMFLWAIQPRAAAV
jgi:uncharacterized damage-inducible protein DinB